MTTPNFYLRFFCNCACKHFFITGRKCVGHSMIWFYVPPRVNQ